MIVRKSRCRLVVLVACSLIWMAAPGRVARAAAPGDTDVNRFAVIIGVTKYTDANTRQHLDELYGPGNDARLLSQALINQGRFKRENVRVLAEGAGDDGIQPPTRENILQALEQVTRQVKDDGLLVFFFAGHGVAPKEKGYLLPSNVQSADDPESFFFKNTAIAVSDLQQAIEKSKAKHVVLVLDTCRDDPWSPRPRTRGVRLGGDGQALAESFNWAFNAKDREIATIFSTQPGAVAYESGGDPKTGYYADALARALRGDVDDAINSSGAVTIAGLMEYLPTAVNDRVQRELGADRNQRPQFVVNTGSTVALTFPHHRGQRSAGGLPAAPSPAAPPAARTMAAPAQVALNVPGADGPIKFDRPPPQLRLNLAAQALSDPGLVVTKNHYLVERLRLGAAIPVAPGKQMVKITLPRYQDWTGDYDLTDGVLDVDVTLQPRRDRVWWSLGAATVGIGTTVAGLLLRQHARDLADDVTALCASGCYYPDVSAKVDDSDRDNTIAKALMGAGIPVAVAGMSAALYFLLTAEPLGPEARGLRVLPAGDGMAISMHQTW
jgi:hypothetical protein